MISAIKDSSIKRNRKKSFRVTFAPGTKTEEEQINNFVRAVESTGPGIDDLSKMIKNLPTKTSPVTEKHHDEEAESISNMILQLRKTLDNMLEKECVASPVIEQSSTKADSERRSSNSSITSVDSAISDCSKSNEYYNELRMKEASGLATPMNPMESCGHDDLDIVNKDTSSISSPDTRQKVSDLLKELDNCIEELREDDIYSPEEELIENALCVKDVFANGILIASFVQTKTEKSPLEQQYAILTDNKIYIFESNRSKSPIKYTFSFNSKSSMNKSVYIKNTIELNGEYCNSCNEKVANQLSLVFSSAEECNIWSKLLYDILMNLYSLPKPLPKRTVSLNVNKPTQYINNNDLTSDYYNPRQTLLSALCVLEGIEKSKTY